MQLKIEYRVDNLPVDVLFTGTCLLEDEDFVYIDIGSHNLIQKLRDELEEKVGKKQGWKHITILSMEFIPRREFS